MSRFYDAVDESLSLISARSPSPSGVAGRQAAGSKSRQTVNLACASSGQVRTTSASRSPPRQVLPVSLPACRASAVITRFIPGSCAPATPLPLPLSVLLTATRLVF